MMEITCKAMENLSIDKDRAFKSLFITNALDGSEDYMVSDRLFSLVGEKIQEIRQILMNGPCPKNLQELLKTITPPKGIKRKNVEGSELFDCDGPELDISQLEKDLAEDFDTTGKI